MSTPDLSFREYLKYHELTDYLQAVAREYPGLVELESIGQSFEGREVWAVSLTNKGTGPAAEKPALYADGNIHAGEVTGSMVLLYTINYLVRNFEQDEEVTRLLNTRAFYIIPRVNPDGAEKYLTTPYMLRSSVRPYPYEGIEDLPGLHPEDIDGDGRILQMRVRDDVRGEWKVSQHDPRLLIAREPDDHGGPFYRIFTEGYIKEYEGQPFEVNPVPWGLDLNRNFPSSWTPDIRTGGTYPTGEPETRNLVEFIVSHNNIGGLQAFHTYGGLFFRNPYQYSDDKMDPDDLRATKEIARQGTLVTGYPDVKSNNSSTLTEWAYEHRGIIGYTTELWDRLGRAGIKREEFYNTEDPAKKEEMQWKLLRWNDQELAGQGFINWREFEHPPLGTVEIGGWDPKFVVQNPPPKFLEQECHKNTLWNLKHAASLPRTSIEEVTVEELEEGVYRIQALLANHGYLPTNITNRARAVEAVNEDRAFLHVPEGAELLFGKAEQEIGFLEGYMNGQKAAWGTPAPARSAARVSWVVRAPEGTQLELTLKSERGGTVRQNVTLQ